MHSSSTATRARALCRSASNRLLTLRSLGTFFVRRERERPRRLFVRAILLLALLSGAIAQRANAQSTGASYVYDSLGRLIAVYDASGDAAVYQYDAVGNLLSITNYPSSQFASVRMSSGGGTTGSNLTIYGTDICSNPTVTINGTNATVDSSNSTQIIVTVPSNATTGQVIVTCGSNQIIVGTFTVASTAPSISGFTPTIGSAGTVVTINGSNFQTVASSDSVRFGNAFGQTGSATTTTLTATVPSPATTGHIAVTTPAGQSVTTGFFFVPPAPATQSTLVTGQMMVGGSSGNMTTSTATPYALVAFDGTAGQQISLNVTPDTISGANIYIIPPGGTLSNAIVNHVTGNGGGIIADVTLPTTGTYGVFVDPSGSATGSLTLQLFSTTDVPINGLVIGGAAVSAGPNVPGQDFSGTFSGTAGQQISLNVTPDTISGASIYIIQPGGTVSNAIVNHSTGTGGGIIADVTLPTTGTYTVFVDPSGSATGSLTLQLFSTTDVPINGLVIGGAAVSAGPNVPGQDFSGTFSGTAGQQISLHVTPDTIASASFYIIQPGGTLSNAIVNHEMASGGGTVTGITLPTTGTYNVFVDPSSNHTGSFTMQVQTP